MGGNKQSNAFSLLALTTGAGIVVGTHVDIGGIYIGSVATTVVIKADTTVQLEVTTSIDFGTPVALSGPITATSSGGSFSLSYITRP